MNEFVSIVLPVYNAELYVEEAINSCLNQTYSKFEVIAVNDGSTDSSFEILDSFSDRIRIISQENKGIAGALNTGIRAMKSNWYKLMNADDVLYPDCVEILISEVSKINDEKVIPYGNYDIINSQGKIIREQIEPNRNDLSEFERNVVLLDHQYVNFITTIIHKSIFLKYGYYNESMNFSEDYELMLRLCLLHGFRFHLIEKKLAKYRNHEGQDTIKKNKIAPDYSNYIRNLILNQLDSLEREKFEIALMQFKKNMPISTRTKSRINDFLLEFFPSSSARKISKIYRKLTHQNPSTYYQEEGN